MGIMSFLRNRLGLIMVIVIGLALFAFIIGEVVHYGSSFMNGDRTTIGEVAGDKISYEDFNSKLDQNMQNFKQQSNQASLNPQMLSYVQQTTWNQEISQIILQKQISKLGITVGDIESTSLIQGSNPSPQVVQAFTNRETGQFDRQQLLGFLQNMSSAKADPATRAQWANFVNQIIEGKKSEKYLSMVRNGFYVNSLEAKDDYEARNKIANFKYVNLDYASLPDKQVRLTDEDYNTYYNGHKNEFKNPEELRSFNYVVFNAAPSKADTAVVKEQINKLLESFKTSKNDSLFVAINAATPAPLVYQKKGQLEPKLDSVMFNAAPGFVYGPYFSNGAYKIAKLISTEVGPDSVKARHILINPATAGGVDKALAKADSLKKLIQAGKQNFADLAKTNSIDGSAAKGGELGTFARGAMVPVFEDAVFKGKKGDLKIVSSQFGVHLIEIEDQKGSSKVVKVAVVDKPLTPSSKTTSAAYAQAQAFLSKTTGSSFDEAVKAEKLKRLTADDVNASASAVTGLENARDVVKWAFGAKTGDVSNQVFELNLTNQYVVAQLQAIKPKGVLALDLVKKQIEPAVRNQVKAKMLEAKFNAVKEASDLDKIAAQVGSKVTPVQNVVFANPIIPGIAQENKVIGTIFGSPLHKTSKPIDGQNGVYVFVVDSFNNPPALNNALKDRQQIAQTALQRLDTDVFNVLKDKANVKDYRAKFF